MKPTNEMLSSIPFQYASDVRAGNIVTGRRIKQAVERFYDWIDNAERDGFTLDHKKGIRAILFFETFLNHTKGKMAGKPFVLAPFQQFTIYNIFGWLDARGFRRINTVYDKRAKKNGKSAEMAGLGLYVMSFDMEMEAEIYVGATKEEQARICWNQAKQFIESPVANPMMKKLGFYVRQSVIGFSRTASTMKPLGGDSKTQDGINAHLSIIDEYHAHKDDTVKENLESSSVQRNQPLVYHITTAGVNVQSACKRYEDSVIEVLEGRNVDNHLWIMIHDMDIYDEKTEDALNVKSDDWEDEANWIKANPLLGQGLDVAQIRKEFTKAINQPTKIPNFKTKHLNMWVDAPQIWIPNEIWMKGKHDLTKDQVREKFLKFGGYSGGDLSTKLDITAYVLLSEPDENGDRYVVPHFFCPNDNIEVRTKQDRVPYAYWRDAKLLNATEGNVVDYKFVESVIYNEYTTYNIQRADFDPWNASALLTNLIERGLNVAELNQTMATLSEPTKEFEALIYSGRIKHDGNPILAWMLAGCTPIYDTKGNMMIAKGKSSDGAKRRIDGIASVINALAGSMSPEPDNNESYYNREDSEFVC
ncbi:MAG: terminase large subunit [Flavobacterium sp.]|nr:MAG: terminase large subunit [Flavobacterium sp.]